MALCPSLEQTPRLSRRVASACWLAICIRCANKMPKHFTDLPEAVMIVRSGAIEKGQQLMDYHALDKCINTECSITNVSSRVLDCSMPSGKVIRASSAESCPHCRNIAYQLTFHIGMPRLSVDQLGRASNNVSRGHPSHLLLFISSLLSMLCL